MIDITNFTEPMHDVFDINFCQKEVDGGIISYNQITEIKNRAHYYVLDFFFQWRRRDSNS